MIIRLLPNLFLYFYEKKYFRRQMDIQMKEIKLRQKWYSPYKNPFLNELEICTGNQVIKHILSSKN